VADITSHLFWCRDPTITQHYTGVPELTILPGRAQVTARRLLLLLEISWWFGISIDWSKLIRTTLRFKRHFALQKPNFAPIFAVRYCLLKTLNGGGGAGDNWNFETFR